MAEAGANLNVHCLTSSAFCCFATQPRFFSITELFFYTDVLSQHAALKKKASGPMIGRDAFNRHI
jgi:hypothetical protein